MAIFIESYRILHMNDLQQFRVIRDHLTQNAWQQYLVLTFERSR